MAEKAEKLVIEIDAEDDAVLERIYAALRDKIEAWLHCQFTVRFVERGVKRRTVWPKGLP